MTARLQIKVDGGDVAGLKMLDCARSVIKMLHGVEKGITGKRPKINWQVDMMAGAQYGLITIWGVSPVKGLTAEVSRLMEAAQAKTQQESDDGDN